MSTSSGVYKTVRQTIAFVWDRSWEKTYADEYKAALSTKGSPTPVKFPLVMNLKEGQEVTIVVGDRRPMIGDIVRIVPDADMTDIQKEVPRKICAVDVTVTVGSKVLSGIVLAYDDKPITVIDDADIRPVKKRQK